MKLSVSFQLLDLGQSAGLLGRVISSSQGLSRVILMTEKLVEWTVLAGETKVIGENLHRRHFVHHKSHLPDQGANLGRRNGKPATNRFSYGAATLSLLDVNIPSYVPYSNSLNNTEQNTVLLDWFCS
jgi:hypothetical protein